MQKLFMTMKIKLIWLVAMLAVCGGCSKSAPDKTAARITALEDRIKYLELMQEGNGVIVGQLVTAQSNNYVSSSNLNAAILTIFDGISNDRKIISQLLDNVSDLSAKQSRPASRPASTPAAPVNKDGIPMDVYNGIVATAKRKYPTDYDMQRFIIKQQSEAWLNVNGKK